MRSWLVPVLAAGLLLTGCQIFSTKSLISDADAAFPFVLEVGEAKAFQACEQNSEDPTDWSDCERFEIRREASHYVLTADKEPESMSVRFASLFDQPEPGANQFTFQTWETDEAEEEYAYGVARRLGNRLFIALPDAKYISSETCLALGAPEGASERQCADAMETLDDLRDVMNEVWDAAQFDVFIEPV